VDPVREANRRFNEKYMLQANAERLTSEEEAEASRAHDDKVAAYLERERQGESSSLKPN
jgi:hypothetical protein